MHPLRLGAIAAALAASLGLERTASAYCRTTTCDPATQTCTPDPTTGCVGVGIPLAWPGGCVGFDVNEAALSGKPAGNVTLEEATSAAQLAFLAWQETQCPDGQGRPSIRVSNLGPIACDQNEYSQDQGNANVIVFRSKSWPYTNAANTLALTTVTFNVETGDIYDADIEVNGTKQLTVGAPPVYDLRSILTHEAGHFLGLAHSPEPLATMYARYEPTTTDLRTLEPDDAAAICKVYPPGRTGMACEPTPRHGFSGACATPGGGEDDTKGCSIDAAGRPGRGGLVAIVAWGLAIATSRRRRRRAWYLGQ